MSGRRPILYIGDDSQSRLLVRRLLEETGHVVVDAANGLDGVEAALREHPLLILLDMSLPDLDGSAVTAILRTFPMLDAIPVVALTPYAVGPGDRDRTMLTGCDGSIEKPIDLDRFAYQVSEFLHGKRESVVHETHLRKLNEQFVSRLLTQLDEVRKTTESITRRAASLERIEQAIAAGPEGPGAVAPPESQAPEVAPAHVLVVEDDIDARETLRLVLELAGHHLAVAETGHEAIERAAEVHPDVMLVDLALPDMDGHDVARRARAAFGKAIFLLALTGYGRAEDVREAEAAGFDVHVLKPATMEELTRVLAWRGRGAGRSC